MLAPMAVAPQQLTTNSEMGRVYFLFLACRKIVRCTIFWSSSSPCGTGGRGNCCPAARAAKERAVTAMKAGGLVAGSCGYLSCSCGSRSAFWPDEVKQKR